MKIAVMIKQVPDSKLIEIDENGNLRRDGVPAMVDPFGFFGLRIALRMKEISELPESDPSERLTTLSILL